MREEESVGQETELRASTLTVVTDMGERGHMAGCRDDVNEHSEDEETAM